MDSSPDVRLNSMLWEAPYLAVRMSVCSGVASAPPCLEEVTTSLKVPGGIWGLSVCDPEHQPSIPSSNGPVPY